MTNRELSGSRWCAGPWRRELLGSWRMWATGRELGRHQRHSWARDPLPQPRAARTGCAISIIPARMLLSNSLALFELFGGPSLDRKLGSPSDPAWVALEKLILSLIHTSQSHLGVL